ncbi:APC family permease [Naumannella halotolerans]|uniref:Amino acid transporter n=1 Tax=Naumannella halotolerans TaxID=993414 RepID=A0A4V3ENC2_9ACTN|nr:APC family permease [Naumannella halotolerans]TDT33238.1 amino acid transporter [Naumannella halotolerans]
MNLSALGKRLLIGRKLSSDQLTQTLLPKRIALPVFASDALSSVAYAPDEILLTLALAGMVGMTFSWPVAIAVAFVMLVVIASYRQNVRAYPSGGGDYEVASANLGRNAGLGVGSALLVDYVLTVAVSVSSGVQNARAIFPWLAGHEAIAAATLIALLMAVNLRGARESGTLFAIPTYAFMVAVVGMVVVGLVRILGFGHDLQTETSELQVAGLDDGGAMTGLAMVVLLMRAFSSGCAALTGVEAISNGVPAFRKPKSRNAATTLGLLGLVAISMMLGVIALANLTGLKVIDPDEATFVRNGQPIEFTAHTAIAQLAEAVFADFRPAFYFVIAATMVILFLAANTAFNGFPVLGSILAKDGYLPRQLHTRGDRLAYSNGIVALAIVAIGLVIAFDASVTALIQLYVVGVFVSFTLSQLGMIRHWNRELRSSELSAEQRRYHLRGRVISSIGFGCTATVLCVVLISKFTHGAWIAILAMLCVFALMKAISRHYSNTAEELAITSEDERLLPSRVYALVLVAKVNKPTVRALAFAKASRPNKLEAITVDLDRAETQQLVEQWEAADLGMPLKVIASPFREMVNPVLAYVRSVRSASPRDVVNVYIPEYVVGHWWERVLHNQTAFFLRARLLFSPGVMVTSVPYLLESSSSRRRRMERGYTVTYRGAGGSGDTGLGPARTPDQRPGTPVGGPKE